MAKILEVEFPCDCQDGKLTFSVEKDGLDEHTVSYQITGTAKCPMCKRVETIASRCNMTVAAVTKPGQ